MSTYTVWYTDGPKTNTQKAKLTFYNSENNSCNWCVNHLLCYTGDDRKTGRTFHICLECLMKFSCQISNNEILYTETKKYPNRK